MIFSTDEFRLLNDWQRGFPLVPQPYALIGARHGLGEEAVIATYRNMIAERLLGRLGVVFRPNTVGASTLAAMAVPPAQLEAVARVVSGLPQVNHNYQREHRLNLWFVVAAPSPADVERVIATIEARTGMAVLRLPLLEEFHIDLGFDLAHDARRAAPAPRRHFAPAARVALDDAGRALVAALDAGLPLVPRPYADLGRQAGLEEDAVLAQLAAWLEQGVIRRIGTVVRHRPLGYRANAMVVWNVPDDQAGDYGREAARHPAVTLCYRRARCGNDWPYNLYCMVHGREQAGVREAIAELATQTGLAGFTSATLFSLRCFTQRGARYATQSAPELATQARQA